MPHVAGTLSSLDVSPRWVELSLFLPRLSWLALSVINIFWLILCELIAKRENARREQQLATAAKLHCGTEHCPCSTTTPNSTCLLPPASCLWLPPARLACGCQRLKTRFSDFHVACWRQRFLNLCKMFSFTAVVIQYAPPPPTPSDFSYHS